jgi:superfamily II DNA or RNA helicase
MKELNSIKAEIQQQAHSTWLAAGRVGTIAAGTGFGKSRVAIMELQRMLLDSELTIDEYYKEPILLVVPTEKLRDENWPKEFADWLMQDVVDRYVKCICFASLKKELGKKYKLVILDEIHRLTDMSAAAFLSTGEDVLTTFMAENLSEAVMGLTATVPDARRDPEKARIIAQIAPVVFTYSLDQGVEDGMIRDYEIRVIQSVLDNVNKNITGGTKLKPFQTTEQAQYEYLEKQIRKMRAQAGSATNPKQKASFDKLAMFATMARNRFIYNLPSKTALAARCIKAISSGKRTLVFAGSIEQCNLLCGENVYHSKSGSSAYNKFNSKEINLLGVVNAANEGVNFVDLDQSLVIQVDSNERNLVQRVNQPALYKLF